MAKLSDIRVLTVSAMMLALSTILGFLKVPVTQLIELRFAFLPIACTGMLFGPAVGGIVGGLSDILGFIVKPTGPYFPGFTITAARISRGLPLLRLRRAPSTDCSFTGRRSAGRESLWRILCAPWW